VIEKLEQLLLDLRIGLAARRPIAVFAVARAGWLGERWQR
jgi:hypothetical protein